MKDFEANIETIKTLLDLAPDLFTRSEGTYMYHCRLTGRFMHMSIGVDVVLAWEMLRSMQEREREIAVPVSPSPPRKTPEQFTLGHLLTKSARDVTPEKITAWYIQWLQSVDAPAASGQELRPQAPAITYETDH